MKRRFWIINYDDYAGGMDCETHTERNIYWGTWMEAARECVYWSIDKSSLYGYRRSVEPFELPDVKNKKKGFYVC